MNLKEGEDVPEPRAWHSEYQKFTNVQDILWDHGTRHFELDDLKRTRRILLHSRVGGLPRWMLVVVSDVEDAGFIGSKG